MVSRSWNALLLATLSFKVTSTDKLCSIVMGFLLYLTSCVFFLFLKALFWILIVLIRIFFVLFLQNFVFFMFLVSIRLCLYLSLENFSFIFLLTIRSMSLPFVCFLSFQSLL